MNYIGPRRARDLAFVRLLREVRRAMRSYGDRESLTWLELFVEQLEDAVCVRCLTLEDALHAIMEAQPSGSIIDPLPNYSPAQSSRPPRRWFRW